MFVLGCIPTLRLVDRVGRRPVIVWSFAPMVVPLAVLGGGSALLIAVVIACLCAYALFSGGPAVLEWTYSKELFPTSIRATAAGVATSISRIGAAAGTYLLPISVDRLGSGTTMLIGAGITAVGWLVSFAWAKETRGRTLAEAGACPAPRSPGRAVGSDATACAKAGWVGPDRTGHRTGRHAAGRLHVAACRRACEVRFPAAWQVREANLLTVSVRGETVWAVVAYSEESCLIRN